ncbi:hypothetical protein BGZ61DRAFT_527664 [Ilyonectria robusta]|uniref:uncharacterized protein n=1 Tax=Ilyonectria robusta TaxID=1079257 RepID=UPI001E8D6271|nr:uncharacterized protein BGZ61DRAFT_527664 [Ilyonectria robusta]KAH8734306.1 hypothetical protein BGZ61DRAFT_527664 [Ilyonectria robusta]
MAAQTAHAEPRIADDWLEVDSAASVVSLDSLPTTDDEADDDASPPKSPVQPSSPPRRPQDTVSRFETLPLRPAPAPAPIAIPVQQASLAPHHHVRRPDALEPDLYSADDAESPDVEPPRLEPPRLEPPPLDKEDACKNANDPGFYKSLCAAIESIDVAPSPSFDKENAAKNANDPSFYYKSLCAVIESLDATTAKAIALGASRISTLSFLKSACDDLATHAKDLKPILETYAKRWEAKGSGMAAGEMPLNASLLEWINTLHMQLLNAQTEMNRIQIQHKPGQPDRLTAKAIPLQVNVALAGCAEALEDSLITMEDFMPIFKADFDESQTRWMSMPLKDVDRETRPRRDLPHPDVTRIRRELYQLKDQVRRSSVFLSTLYNTATQPPILEAPAVIKRLDGLIEGISTILTNNASEWIESELTEESQKVIPYHEFVALDPDVIHDVSGHLEELQDQLGVDGEESGNYTEGMIRKHQAVLLTQCGQLDELVSIVELLESLILARV